jgi:segregation and condensation protein A
MLLPREPSEELGEDIEDPRQELVDRLLEYERYKSAAQMLYERTTVEQAIFQRGKIDTDENNAEINASVFDLLNVFQKIVARHKDEVQMEIHREEISLADMLKNLKRRLLEFKELSVLAFFEEMHTKRELVTAFVAVLEIARTEGIRLTQSSTFGDIILRAS